MANFSSKKKASKPISKVANRLRGSACDSNASGKACSREVDSMMPTDRLTMRSTTLDKNANEKIAAAVMLNRPAMVVASNMDKRTGSMISYLKMGAGSRAPAVLASGLMTAILLII